MNVCVRTRISPGALCTLVRMAIVHPLGLTLEIGVDITRKALNWGPMDQAVPLSQYTN
jgi:hypothetical protein